MWGDNNTSQLGDGTTTDKLRPAPLPGATDAQQAGGGGSHTLAWRGDGTVYAWGSNVSGRLGNGTITLPPSPPVQVVDIDGGGTFNLLADSRPDVFGFTPVITAAPNTQVASNTVVISGTDGAAPISITGGEYSFDGTTFTASPGVVNPGSSLTIRMQSAPTFATTLTAAVNVGGIIGAFNVTTVPQDLVPNAFVFAPKTGIATSVPVVSDPVTIVGINAASPISIVNGEYQINSGPFTSSPGTVNAGNTVTVRIQSAAAPLTSTWAVVSIGGVSAVFAATTGGGASLLALFIGGPSIVSEGASAAFTATAIYGSGSSATVSPAWSVTAGTAATINPTTGVLTANLVTASETVTISASYSDGTTTLSANTVVTVRDLVAASAPVLEPNWNLLGNSLDTPINVAARFGNQDAPVAGVTENVTSVWKWNAVDGRWAFYSPQLTAATIVSFAASKGYEVLATINPGEGYWVNAILAMRLPAQAGADYDWNGFGFAALPPGFSLIAHATTVTPSQFNYGVSVPPPAQGTIPTGNFLSLWAWDAAAGNWYFYSPLLESSGGLAAVKSYADSKFYRHFQDYNKTLGLGVGFWVNRP